MSPALPLEIRGLGHAYGAVPVLDAVDLTLEPGGITAVLGASGCGKTTLLRSVAGLVTPRRGVVRIAGRDVVRDGRELVPVERRRIGLVFQEYALFPHMTVRENVAFGLRAPDDARVAALLELVGVGHLADRRPGALSGGQQQRVALARALAPRPHLLLLDEPFANVDAELRATLGMELVEVLARQGQSALMVTHDQGDAMAYATHLAILVPGERGARVAQHGTPEDVYRRPATRRVAELVGPTSWLPGEAEALMARTALGPVPLLEARRGPVQVLVRPEQAAFVADPSGPARVVARRFLGRGHRLSVQIADVRLQADWTGGDPPAIGAPGRLEIAGPCWAPAA